MRAQKTSCIPGNRNKNHTGAKIRHKDKALQDVGTGAFPR